MTIGDLLLFQSCKDFEQVLKYSKHMSNLSSTGSCEGLPILLPISLTICKRDYRITPKRLRMTPWSMAKDRQVGESPEPQASPTKGLSSFGVLFLCSSVCKGLALCRVEGRSPGSCLSLAASALSCYLSMRIGLMGNRMRARARVQGIAVMQEV